MAEFTAHGPSTPVKLERVRKILPWVIKMAAPHVYGAGGVFWYIEANAGPGVYEGVDGVPLTGSPIIALEALRELGVPYRAVLIDSDQGCTDRLQSALVDRGFSDPQQVRVLCEDNRAALQRIGREPHPSKDRGLIFFDEQGAPRFPLIREVMGYREMRRIDLLVNIPTATLKLMRRAAHSPRFGGRGYAWDALDVRPLSERLPDFQKVRYLIGEPTTDRLHWSLILGSTWPKFPEWKAGQFDASDSATGSARLRRISLSERERAEEDLQATVIANQPYFEGLLKGDA